MIQREQILAAVRAAVAEIGNSPLSKPEDDARPLLEGGFGLTSVQLLELISTLEQNLDFQFEEEDLRMRSFSSTEVLTDTIMPRLQK